MPAINRNENIFAIGDTRELLNFLSSSEEHAYGLDKIVPFEYFMQILCVFNDVKDSFRLRFFIEFEMLSSF